MGRGLVVVVWMAVIFAFSAQTGGDSGGLSQWAAGIIESITGIDVPIVVVRKMAHVTVYAVLGVATAWWCRTWPQRWGRARAVMAAAIVVAYACFDELHQTFVAGRDGRLFDIALDSVAGVIAVTLFWWASERWARRREARSEVTGIRSSR
ncbi:MAG: VanZ family protein [Propionibacteriaceae bacterium]|nr:VanZ family protein [Propionibacteriaceae bacterium]